MEINLRRIEGNWDNGFSLDKHTLWSKFLGYNETGYPVFDTLRSDVGEALYQLKYRADWSQVPKLAQAIVTHIVPKIGDVGFVVPVPSSTPRRRQPVYELAKEVASIMGLLSLDGVVVKTPDSDDAPALKNVNSKEEKVAILEGRFTIFDEINEDGIWNVLVIDDLFDTGATLEAVCKTLRTYSKVDHIYAATLTWK